MRALITGSSGFIGRHLAERLKRDGHDVYGVDIRAGVHTRLVMDCREIYADFEHGADWVIHCAAHVGGRASIDGNPLGIAENLELDAAMFRWAVGTKPRRVIYFSSSAAYPTCLQVKEPAGLIRLREDHIRRPVYLEPDAMYGWSKLTGERLAAEAEAEGVKVHIFRPFSGYGSDQSLDYPFPSFVKRAINREDPFEIWGDGTQARDWIHVDDIIEAVLTAIEQGVRGPVNLCTGIGTPFLELAEMVTQRAGYTPEIKTLPDKPTGVHYRVGDPTKMLEFYTPKISLEEGIDRAFRDQGA